MAGDLLPYFKVYPAETIADERFAGWTMAERGTWFTFILHAWTNGSIPADEVSLSRIARMPLRSFRPVWLGIADRFIQHPDMPGRLTSRRLEMEREEALIRSEAGKTGAKSRWRKETVDATALRPQCDRNAEPMRTPMPAEQNRAEQSSAAQSARSARVGVGHPAFEAIDHWTGVVWPRLSEASCPDVTTPQAQSLAVLSQKHGASVICAAMDAAAADTYWAKSLDLDGFIAKHAKWLGRKNPRAGTGDLGADYRRKWWHELTKAEAEEFNRQRCEIDPDLDGVPLDAVGINRPEEVAALIERWRTRDGQRRVQAASG